MYFFFHLVTTLTPPWLREKPFSPFRHYVQYAMVTQKEIWFYWITTLTTLRSWKKGSFFISLGRSLWKYLPTWSYFAHYITNLWKKFPNGMFPGKNVCNLKNCLPQEFQWSLTWFTSLNPNRGESYIVSPDWIKKCSNKSYQ